jgi:hypothetical protein
MIPLVIASDFTGLLPFIVGIPLLIALLSLVSYLPALRGHWLAPVMAVPPFLVGLLCTISLVTEGGFLGLWFVFPAPLVVSSGALVVWFRRRAAKRKTALSSHEEKPA